MKPIDTIGRLRYEIREELDTDRLSGFDFSKEDLQKIKEELQQ